MCAKYIFQTIAFAVSFVLCISTDRTARCQQYAGVVLYPISFPYTESHVSEFPSAASGGQVVGSATIVQPVGPGNSYAHLWVAPGGEPVDLTPANGGAVAYGTDGTQQVGVGSTGAILWDGTATSAVAPNPTNLLGFIASTAYGVKAGQQVGYGQLSGGAVAHALLWNGTADSAVDLNPPGFGGSTAIGTDGLHQVGYGGGPSTVRTHALLWSGSANSVVDLHPTQFSDITDTFAYGVGGGQEVGVGLAADGLNRAIVWSGSANSAVELHPTGFDSSTAYGTNGIYQVGFGSFEGDLGGIPSNIHHALLWNGSAASVVDLNSLLPFSPRRFGGLHHRRPRQCLRRCERLRRGMVPRSRTRRLRAGLCRTSNDDRRCLPDAWRLPKRSQSCRFAACVGRSGKGFAVVAHRFGSNILVLCVGLLSSVSKTQYEFCLP